MEAKALIYGASLLLAQAPRVIYQNGTAKTKYVNKLLKLHTRVEAFPRSMESVGHWILVISTEKAVTLKQVLAKSANRK